MNNFILCNLTQSHFTLQLIEFNDTTKTGHLEDQHPNDTKVYDLKHFNWTRNLVETDNKTVAIRLVGENFMLENSSLAGTVNLTVYKHLFLLENLK